jgi:hypothetical protein
LNISLVGVGVDVAVVFVFVAIYIAFDKVIPSRPNREID